MAVPGVFHDHDQNFHADVNSKQAAPVWERQQGASPWGSPYNDFSKSDNIGLSATRENSKR